MSDQFVYFIQADDGGPIKIGFTTEDPKRRLSQLQTANASVLKLLGAIRGTSARERQFHADLAEWRLQGEWFAAHPTVLAAVQSALDAPSEPQRCGDLRCSFCGVCEHHTTIMIAGEGVYICGRCSILCAEITNEHLLKIVAPAPEAQDPIHPFSPLCSA